MKQTMTLLLWIFAVNGITAAADSSSSSQFYTELRQSLDQINPSPNPIDPNEPINRKMFQFNEWLIQNVVNPTAHWLGDTLPGIIQQAGHNIYDNLVEPEFILTNSLVGNYEAAKISTKRFLINSTIGLAGLWDPAKNMGYQRTEMEFTESLCVAGLFPGNFIVLPVIGPTSSNSAMLITSFFAMEWYLLSFISPIIATADLFIDISASAASLRYARDVPESTIKDPYAIQRANYQNYLWPRCSVYFDEKIFLPGNNLEVDKIPRSP
ncbi:phospholipid-binding lipoprotein MlaA [Gammaproteobacteria bacterium]